MNCFHLDLSSLLQTVIMIMLMMMIMIMIGANRNNFNWPIVRWKQTGEVGYVPNDRLEYVFMAAAMDDDIDLHPKNKRLPSSRLAWAALNLVYGGNSQQPIRG